MERSRLEWNGEASGDAAEHRDGGDGKGSCTTCSDVEEFYAVCNKSDGGVGAVSEYAGADVYVLRTEGTLEMGCAEILANEAKTMAVARGGTEMKGGSKHPNYKGLGPGPTQFTIQVQTVRA